MSQSLQEATSHGLEQFASPLTAAVISGWVLEKCTSHLRQASEIAEDSQERQFWLRHQQLDSMIAKILMSLPDHLRASSTREPLAFFVNMCFHEFTISIFQAAILVAQKSPSRFDTVARLRSRARRAAEQIVDIMRLGAYMDIRLVSRKVQVNWKYSH